ILVPAGERPPLSRPQRSCRVARRLRRRPLSAVRGRDRRAPHRGEGMTPALTEIRTAPGLDAYLDALEVRLERAVEAYPGVVAVVGKESLAAGGKRLRPVIVFLSAAVDGEQPLAAGVA